MWAIIQVEEMKTSTKIVKQTRTLEGRGLMLKRSTHNMEFASFFKNQSYLLIISLITLEKKKM